jgi:hypothetical protein
MKLAHRVSYELEHGVEPGDLCVCHSCDNPLCVRPDHLWLGTQADNLADRNNKGRQRALTGEDHLSAKLTWDDVENIRANEMNLTQHELAAAFGVSQSAIAKILRRVTWIQ